MNNRNEELSNFLKLKREQIKPEDVGFTASQNRRSKGLRREEVAILSNISTSWYTWVEQGKNINISDSVFQSISKALKLTKDEKIYFFNLIRQEDSLLASDTNDSQLPNFVKNIVNEINNCPIIVFDRYCNITYWNELAQSVFIDFDMIDENKRNIIRLLFEKPEFKRLALNWEKFVRQFMAMFRSYYVKNIKDNWYQKFIEEMSIEFPEFERIWKEININQTIESNIIFRHAKIGKLTFEMHTVHFEESDNFKCAIYIPSNIHDTKNKITRLYN
ncbi:helix-turn-helix domain-containing protein [Staphylococcus succinus]|uniref:Transcriptional regulator n=1 Tax=Staphylococcus succinus TaxID=61015 RepID=A0ABX5IIV7_9STAP|nr:helix-turn-helix transcriptional regulator [Staphylococcus succinus]PTI65909.1 transcriptional regulator [Staphylococcus succinus]RIN35564.1 XRE family transcriptional regulator [Staphylococcus succinus]